MDFDFQACVTETHFCIAFFCVSERTLLLQGMLPAYKALQHSRRPAIHFSAIVPFVNSTTFYTSPLVSLQVLLAAAAKWCIQYQNSLKLFPVQIDSGCSFWFLTWLLSTVSQVVRLSPLPHTHTIFILQGVWFMVWALKFMDVHKNGFCLFVCLVFEARRSNDWCLTANVTVAQNSINFITTCTYRLWAQSSTSHHNVQHCRWSSGHQYQQQSLFTLTAHSLVLSCYDDSRLACYFVWHEYSVWHECREADWWD